MTHMQPITRQARTGTLWRCVDDAGQLPYEVGQWARTLAIVPGEDSFTVLPPKLETLKLYMPLIARSIMNVNDYGDLRE